MTRAKAAASTSAPTITRSPPGNATSIRPPATEVADAAERGSPAISAATNATGPSIMGAGARLASRRHEQHVGVQVVTARDDRHRSARCKCLRNDPPLILRRPSPSPPAVTLSRRSPLSVQHRHQLSCPLALSGHDHRATLNANILEPPPPVQAAFTGGILSASAGDTPHRVRAATGDRATWSGCAG
jgi:hypothetical protein